MKFYKKRVKGKTYFVGREKLCIASGKKKEISKSYGLFSNIFDFDAIKKDFLDFSVEKETEARLEFWNKKIKNKKLLKYSNLKKIETLRAKIIKSRETFLDFKNCSDFNLVVSFIYNSNKIEGSRVPKSVVEKIVQSKKIKKNDEVENSIKALNKVNQNFIFNIKQIIDLHSVLLLHEPAKHNLRKEKIVVGNSNLFPPEQIRKELKSLLDWYLANKNKLYPPQLAFDFYYKFERIHPFIDGNGRVGRLLMNKILKDACFYPIVIWDSNRKAHFSAFEKAMNGRMEYFYKFMFGQMIKTYETIIKHCCK